MTRTPLFASVWLLAGVTLAASAPKPAVGPEVVERTVKALVAKHGRAQEARARQGVGQVAQRWWGEDGDAGAFASFCEQNFVADPAQLAAAVARLERVLEQTEGRLHEIRRELLTPLDLDTGPVHPVDRLLATLDLRAHLNEDLFASKTAFFALLNFPVHTLADRLRLGGSWDRDAWARSRMMDRFADRIPAPALQEVTRATTAADQYIAGYYVRLDRLRTEDGKQLFPDGLRVITHWGLRDELASHYGEPDALAKQRLIQKAMERIVRQEIPAAAVDNGDLLYFPEGNRVQPLPGAKPVAAADLAVREPDTRYARWIDNFRAMRGLDPYTPGTPSAIARACELGRQIPERETEKLLVTVLSAPEVKQVGDLIARRLGRPLEPFDIWYAGFKSRAGHSEEELDRAVRARYATAAAFQADLPRILRDLGFSADRVQWLAGRIVVDASRGAGHAMGAARREDRAHLRTHVAAGGMNYKGYNIAVHEFGHNVEQVFSLNGVDRWFLAGVPASGFSETFAYAFQDRDLELLGLGGPGEEARRTKALGGLWVSWEIGGVSLIDLRAWNWLYANPDATPAQLREAVRAIAREVWNAYFAPVIGVPDCDLLAVYSHTVAYPLYLPDYFIGHLIEAQVGEKLKGPAFGAEFERMARQGAVTPDAWLRGAVSEPLSAEPLLRAAREALAGAK
jgi:hypothetical protein